MTINEAIDNKTKNFILNNLYDITKQVQSSIDDSYDNCSYKIDLDYICQSLEVIIKDYLPKDYELIKKDIELIDLQQKSKRKKMLAVCRKLIELGQKITKIDCKG